MKTIQLNGKIWPKNAIICDYKEDPEDVMNEVNNTISKFGLEVIKHDNNSDTFVFSIKLLKEKHRTK